MALNPGMADTTIAWTHEVEEALDRARTSARHVLVDFTAAPL